MLPATLPTNSEPDELLGSVTPRLYTPPLRDLTPDTSYGFDVIDFARDVLGTPLDPWEEWTVIHAGELLPDGRPRFRTALIIVARQNGKTMLARVLTLYWLFIEQVPLVLGLANKLAYAKVSWQAVLSSAKHNQWLKPEIGKTRFAIGEECLTTTDGAEYRIAAANKDAGRSLTVHRLILDELRSHKSWDAWNAATNAMNAVPHGQVVAITNQGDDESVVLDALRGSALAYLETGRGDKRLGLFEYSAPDGADPTDPQALAAANPNLGRRVDFSALMAAAQRAKRAGGEELTGFRTEVLCQRVHLLDPAIDPDRWDRCLRVEPLDLALHREQVALCVDVSLDGSHATLVAAALLDGKVHTEVVAAWDGYGCTKELRAELPRIVERVRPRALGWFPNGPAAAVAAELADRKVRGWPARRVVIDELKGETTAVCMGLADMVQAGELRHPGDEILTAHVRAASKLYRGDAYVYSRKGSGPIDAAYALAGAVHLARTLPPPPPKLVAL